jgi:hypothetical protein
MNAKTLFDQIGVDETINAILVMANTRPAFMVQPPDYQEKTSKDPHTRKTLAGISQHFPSLHQMDTEWGIIISKEKLNPTRITSGIDVGNTLGYFCTDTYADVLRDVNTKKHVSYEIIVQLKGHSNAHLLATLCPDNSSRKKFEDLRTRIEATLRADKMISPILESVDMVESVVIPPAIVLEKLSSNKPILEEDINVVKNVIYNSGYSFELQWYEFDYSDQFHRGILAMILANHMHDPMKAFWPLQKYPKEADQVVEQTQKLEQTIMGMLSDHQKSKAVTSGGYRRRRKTRRSKH